MDKNDLRIYKDSQKEFRRRIFRVMVRNMVYDNILCKPFIPDTVELVPDEYRDMRFQLKFKEKDVTADIFDKTVSKISKKLMMNPSVNISTSDMSASWTFTFKSKYGVVWVYLDLTTKNTEQCEVVITRKLYDSTELTGYCKLLQEKKYFETQHN